MACTGNSSEVCGGSGLLTVYYANKPIPEGPHINPGPSGWTSFGCYADVSTKALGHEVQVEGGSSNMTVTGCTSACDAAGYKLSGVEYASKTIVSHKSTSKIRRLTANIQANATVMTS